MAGIDKTPIDITVHCRKCGHSTFIEVQPDHAGNIPIVLELNSIGWSRRSIDGAILCSRCLSQDKVEMFDTKTPMWGDLENAPTWFKGVVLSMELQAAVRTKVDFTLNFPHVVMCPNNHPKFIAEIGATEQFKVWNFSGKAVEKLD